jgi:hypothetical protein
VPTSVVLRASVTIRPVQKISRKDWDAGVAYQNPQRPYARHPRIGDEDMVPTAWRHAGTAVNVRKELRFAWKLACFQVRLRAKFLVG